MPWFDERRYESRWTLFCRVHHLSIPPFAGSHPDVDTSEFSFQSRLVWRDVLENFRLKNLKALKNVYVICVILHWKFWDQGDLSSYSQWVQTVHLKRVYTVPTMESVWVHGFFLCVFFFFQGPWPKNSWACVRVTAPRCQGAGYVRHGRSQVRSPLVILVNCTHIPLDVLYFVKFEIFTKKQSQFREMFITLVSLSKAWLNPFNIFEKELFFASPRYNRNDGIQLITEQFNISYPGC